MKTLLLSALLALSATASAHDLFGRGELEGDGHVVTSQREVGPFHRVVLRTQLDAEISRGDATSVTVAVDSNLQGEITVQVEGDELVVDAEREIDPDRSSRVRITLPDLRGVELAGAGDVDIRGFSADSLGLLLSGAGDVTFRGGAHRLDAQLSGVGDLKVDLDGRAERIAVRLTGTGNVELASGAADRLDARVSGAGSVEAKHLVAHSAELEVSGVGGISARLDGGDARFEVSGIGGIEWWGDAQVRSEESEGMGGITHHRG